MLLNGTCQYLLRKGAHIWRCCLAMLSNDVDDVDDDIIIINIINIVTQHHQLRITALNP